MADVKLSDRLREARDKLDDIMGDSDIIDGDDPMVEVFRALSFAVRGVGRIEDRRDEWKARAQAAERALAEARRDHQRMLARIREIVGKP